MLVKKDCCQGAAPLIVLTWRVADETVVAFKKVVEKDDAVRRPVACVVPTRLRLFTGWMLRLDVASPVIVPSVIEFWLYILVGYDIITIP